MVGYVTSDHLMREDEDDQLHDKRSAEAQLWQHSVGSYMTTDQLTHDHGNVLWTVVRRLIS